MCDNNVLDRNKESITRGCWKFYNEGSQNVWQQCTDRNKESITRGCWKFYNEGSHSKIHLIHFVVVVT